MEKIQERKQGEMEKKQHPSYGMIRICRSHLSGPRTALFGSSIMHNNVIRLSISKGELERERNEDKFYAKGSMKDKDVAVVFEKEEVNTMDSTGEILITILSSLATLSGKLQC